MAKCKNNYHVNLRKLNRKEVADIDKILHRNHSILQELLGKNKHQIKRRLNKPMCVQKADTSDYLMS